MRTNEIDVIARALGDARLKDAQTVEEAHNNVAYTLLEILAQMRKDISPTAFLRKAGVWVVA